MEPALKQRLIGAIVLVALAVIFLPMLIKGPAPDSGVSDISLDVPAAPTGGYETRELPLAAPGDPPSGGAVGLATGEGESPALDDGADASSSDARLPPGAAAGNYAVGFGAYASTGDADTVIARLAQSRLPAYREAATINGREAYRVRIGPYADRADAEAARLQAVTIRNDVNAQVLVLDAQAVTPAAAARAAQEGDASPAAAPASAAPAPSAAATPAAPASPPAAADVGFAVQLGAFAKAADANALRDRVRTAGFSAFVEPVRTDKGTLNRVRVGPVASRAEAERLKSQLASRFGIDGMIRPHP